MQNNYKKIIISVLIGIIIGLIIGIKACGKDQTIVEKIVVQSDTIKTVKHDTERIKEYVRVPVTTYSKKDTQTVYVSVYKDTLRYLTITDTIRVNKITLPFPKDSITVDRLVDMKVPRDTVFVNQSTTVTLAKKKRFGLYMGVGMNYSELDKRVMPNMSLGLKDKKDRIYKVGLFTNPLNIKNNPQWYKDGYVELMIPLKLRQW